MLIDLAGKVVAVTGAGRGMGRDIVRTFAQEGAVTVALDVDAADLEETAALVRSTGASGSQHVVDVRDGARVQEVVDAAVAEHGCIDVLINNAGVAGDGAVEALSDAAWERCLGVNTTGVFHTCRAVVPVMKRQRSGRILNAAKEAALRIRPLR